MLRNCSRVSRSKWGRSRSPLLLTGDDLRRECLLYSDAAGFRQHFSQAPEPIFWPEIRHQHLSRIAIDVREEKFRPIIQIICIPHSSAKLSSPENWTHYEVLGVPRNASSKQIKDAYIKLSKEVICSIFFFESLPCQSSFSTSLSPATSGQVFGDARQVRLPKRGLLRPQ